jgi:integrase
MIQIQRLTGCRPGEVCAIRPGDIDRTNDVWRYLPGSHKMEHKNRHRVVLIGPKAQAILKPYLLRAADEFCFHRKNGKAYERDHYGKAIKRGCDKAYPAPEGTEGDELKAWRKEYRWAPNRLRHSAATSIREGFGLEAAQTVLGHASADVTQIYAERDIERAAEVMGKIG